MRERPLSALNPRADFLTTHGLVRLVPEADIVRLLQNEALEGTFARVGCSKNPLCARVYRDAVLSWFPIISWSVGELRRSNGCA